MIRGRLTTRDMARLLAGLLIGVTAATAQDVPRFSAGVDAVRVDVLVTAGGRPVTGLSAGDFELTDNGVAQTVELVSGETTPVNVVLAFDMSESVSGERLAQLRRASAALLGALRPDDQAALVTFTEKVRLAAPLSTDRRSIIEALNIGTGSGTTSLADGVVAGLLAADSVSGRTLLIVFSDGVDTTSWLTAPQAIDAARRSNVIVYVAATRTRTSSPLLKEVTAATGGQLHEIDRIQNLDATFLRILAEFRSRYLISYSPERVTRSGWHTLQVRVKGRSARVQARPGYFAGP